MVPEDEKRIIVQCMRERLPLPQKIQNAPALQHGLELYYGAFFDLSTCRQIGFGVSPIPWNVIEDYARTYEFDDEQTDDLFYFVRHMDHAFINHHSKKTEKPVGQSPPIKTKHGKRFA